MKTSIIMSLLFSASAFAQPDMKASHEPQQAARHFNEWYIQQVTAGKFPIADSNEIDKYVTADSLNELRHAQDPRYADEEFYDADFFLKAQDTGEDWLQNVTVVSAEYDPVCTNVYIAFGKKEEHIIIDCMVRENGIWKVKSVARQLAIRPYESRK